MLMTSRGSNEMSLEEDRDLRALVIGWADTDRVRHLKSWNSRTARLTLWDADGAQLMTKQVESPEVAARLHRTMDAFADAAPPGVRRLRPLGWARQPPCVCMPYVDAPSLETLIRREWFLWKAPPIEDVVARVGTALAAFHSTTRNADWIAREDAALPLSWALEHAGPHEAALRAAADATEPVQVYDDINPSHVLVEASMITLIDLPNGTKIAHPHRDLAWFADQLFATLLRSLPRVPAARQLARLADLRRQLLVAYFDAVGSELTEPDDHLVAAFQAFYLARRKGRERSWVVSGLLRPPLAIQSRRLRSFLAT